MTNIRPRSASETQPLLCRLQAILPSTANMTLTDRQPERHHRRLSVGSYEARQHSPQLTTFTASHSDRVETGTDDSSCGIDSKAGVADMARRLRFRRYHSHSAFNKWNLSTALSFSVVNSPPTSSSSPASSFPVNVIPQIGKKTPNVQLLRSRSLTSCATIPETDSDSSRSGRRSTSLSPQTPPRTVTSGERIHQHQQHLQSGMLSDYMKNREVNDATDCSGVNRRAADRPPSTPESAEKSRGSSRHLRHPDCLSLSESSREGNRPPSNQSSSDPDEDSSSARQISRLLSPRRVDKSGWSDRSSVSNGSRHFDVGRDELYQSDRHPLNVDVLRHHLGLQLNASAFAAAALRSTSPGCYDLQYRQFPGCHHLLQSLQPAPFRIGGALGFQFPTAGSHAGVDPLRICLDEESTDRSVYGSCSQLQTLQCGIGVMAPESNICLYFQLYF